MRKIRTETIEPVTDQRRHAASMLSLRDHCKRRLSVACSRLPFHRYHGVSLLQNSDKPKNLQQGENFSFFICTFAMTFGVYTTPHVTALW